MYIVHKHDIIGILIGVTANYSLKGITLISIRNTRIIQIPSSIFAIHWLHNYFEHAQILDSLLLYLRFLK